MNQQTQPDERPDLMRDTKGILMVLFYFIHAFAVPHEVFFRWPGSFGKKYLGLNAVLGVLLLVPTMVSLVPPEEGAQHLWTYWHITYWLGIGQLLLSKRKRPAGVLVHTQYIGDSIFEKLLPRIKRDSAIGLEWLSSILICMACLNLCATLGLTIALAGTLNFVHYALLNTRDERQSDAAIDAQLEAEAFERRFRERFSR